MSKSKKKKSIAQVHENKSVSSSSQIIGQIHQGPLPSADQLAKYEEYIPGSAERIIKMAENKLNHACEIDKETLKVVSQERRRGQYMAFFIGAFGILGAIYLGLEGYSFAGISIGIAGIILIVTQAIMDRAKN